MTNAPETRRTHVVRIFGTNKAGDVLSDIWADVERIDIAKSVTQSVDVNWQGQQRKFLWMDDPDSGDYAEDGNPARKTTLVKVCSPDEADVEDPKEWIPIKAITSLKARSSGQGVMDRLINDELSEARKVTVRRIVHYDTNIDDDAQKAADAGRKAYVVPGDNYQKDLETKDKDQHVEHEIIEYLKHRTNERGAGGLDVNRGRQTKLLNQYLIDESEEPEGNVTGGNGFNPPYRLDPYQNIVNVKFSESVIVIINDTFYAPSSTVGSWSIPAGKNVTFLGAIAARYQVDGFSPPPQSTWAFKTSSNAGEFINVVAPVTTFGTERNVLNCSVYAIDPKLGIDRSLQQAFAGAQLETVGWYTSGTDEFSRSGSDLPGQVDPPGLLWSIQVLARSGETVTFKIRNGAHRNDNNPLNKMVQLYPLGKPRVIGGLGVVSGYALGTYRLDKTGTGQSYAIGPPIPDFGEFDPGINGLLVDPPWRQVVAHAPLIKGIPYSDPPPLVSTDQPSQGGGFKPPYSN